MLRQNPRNQSITTALLPRRLSNSNSPKSLALGLRDDSAGKSTSCASKRTWVQVLSTHERCHHRPHVPGTSVLGQRHRSQLNVQTPQLKWWPSVSGQSQYGCLSPCGTGLCTSLFSGSKMAPDMCDGYTTKAEPSENDAYVMGNLGIRIVFPFNY